MDIDLILVNGRIYTMDVNKPRASAIAIAGNRIAAIGTDDDISPLLHSGGKSVDLRGYCVIPGLVDAHMHFQGYALSFQQVDLAGAASLQLALETAAESALSLSPAGWIEGRGWNQEDWPDRRFPSAQDLDGVFPNRPVYLRHRSGHAAWVNSKAMELAGLDENTPDPEGGRIERNSEGMPTGILLEKAMKLVSGIIPRPSVDRVASAIRQAQIKCLELGLTGVHDFDGLRCFYALQNLRQDDDLRLRVVKNLPYQRIQQAIDLGLVSGSGDDWLRLGSIKIYADGALGPRTAAMIDAYEGESDNRGIVVTDKEEMAAHVQLANDHGLGVAIHAIGDRANRDVLDVFESAGRRQAGGTGSPGSSRLIQRVEHAQLLSREDIGRFARLGVIASMQPIHATSDMEMAESRWGKRCRLAYAWRSLHEEGALLAFGSDAPVEPIDPLLGIHAAVTRRRLDGSPGPAGWYPEQCITVEQAIKAFTAGPASASGQLDRLGSISTGKLADLTILERDIFSVPADEIPDIPVAGTMLDGRFVVRRW